MIESYQSNRKQTLHFADLLNFLIQFEMSKNADGMDENNAPIPISNYQNLDAEKVLDRLGKYGTYQVINNVIYPIKTFR